MSEAKKGSKHTEETKLKISNMVKGKNVGEDNHFYGKHHTEETKEKIRMSQKKRLEQPGERS